MSSIIYLPYSTERILVQCIKNRCYEIHLNQVRLRNVPYIKKTDRYYGIQIKYITVYFSI